MSPAPLLRLTGIGKTFAGIPALSGANLTAFPGEIHALMGENGAGKSTFLSILSGALERDTGTVEWDGAPVEFRSPQAAQKAGVAFITQELLLVPPGSVAENVFLGREPRRFGLIQWRTIYTGAEALLARLGVIVDVRRPLSECSTAVQQMTAIARALSQQARLLVMDEPTSSLDADEIRTLFGVLRQLKADGVSLLFVSHKLDEVYDLGDRVTVLRDGKTVMDGQPLSEISRLALVASMLGKDLDTLAREGQTGFDSTPRTPGDALLQAEHLSGGAVLQDVSVQVRAGEIVGLAGLLGSGRTETARACFGAGPHGGMGTITFAGQPVRFRSPADAIHAGLGFCSEDRKRDGIIPHLSVRENLTLAALPALSRFGVVSRARQTQIVDDFIRRLGIKTAGPGQPIRELSGGNQQKVLLARWLCLSPQLLLLDEPTRGIDVGAKGEIQKVIDGLARAGMGVLLISSETEELSEGADRVVVLRDGVSVAAFERGQATQAALLTAMAGESPHPPTPSPARGKRGSKKEDLPSPVLTGEDGPSGETTRGPGEGVRHGN